VTRRTKEAVFDAREIVVVLSRKGEIMSKANFDVRAVERILEEIDREAPAPWKAFPDVYRDGEDYGIQDASGRDVVRICGLEQDANWLLHAELIVRMRNAIGPLKEDREEWCRAGMRLDTSLVYERGVWMTQEDAYRARIEELELELAAAHGPKP